MNTQTNSEMFHFTNCYTSCPKCHADDGFWPADFVDNGVGMEKCGPAHCEACGWSEPTFNDFLNSLTNDEQHERVRCSTLLQQSFPDYGVEVMATTVEGETGVWSHGQYGWYPQGKWGINEFPHDHISAWTPLSVAKPFDRCESKPKTNSEVLETTPITSSPIVSADVEQPGPTPTINPNDTNQ